MLRGAVRCPDDAPPEWPGSVGQ